MELPGVKSTIRDDLAGTRARAIGAIRRRRRVVYVEGYDPAGKRLFRAVPAGVRSVPAAVADLSIKLHPLEIDSEDFAHWSLDLRGSDWGSATRYDFLRLESFIRADMAQPAVTQAFRGLL